jgi:hypothetical protein
VAAGRDGTTIVTRTVDNTIKLWDATPALSVAKAASQANKSMNEQADDPFPGVGSVQA